MRNKALTISLTIIFLSIFYIFYQGLQNPNIYEPKIEIGNNIPTFEATLFDTDTKISSEEIFENDQFYLLNIWASWCIPCRDEHSFLMNLKTHTNIKIIGLNYKDKISNAKIFYLN